MVMGAVVDRSTYNTPAENMAAIPIFFLIGIFSFQTDGIGRIIIATLETTLKTPVDSRRALLLQHLPCAKGFEILDRGIHSIIWKINSRR